MAGLYWFRKYGGLLQRPNCVEEVDITLLFADPPIDKRIENLVRAFAIMDLDIEASCEGHLRTDRNPYPWVYVSGLDHNETIQSLLVGYNQISQIHWRIEVPGHLRPVSKAANDQELEEMQNSANLLAKFLFKRGYLPNRTADKT